VRARVRAHSSHSVPQTIRAFHFENEETFRKHFEPSGPGHQVRDSRAIVLDQAHHPRGAHFPTNNIALAPIVRNSRTGTYRYGFTRASHDMSRRTARGSQGAAPVPSFAYVQLFCGQTRSSRARSQRLSPSLPMPTTQEPTTQEWSLDRTTGNGIHRSYAAQFHTRSKVCGARNSRSHRMIVGRTLLASARSTLCSFASHFTPRERKQ
jgi:hypothetical protein